MKSMTTYRFLFNNSLHFMCYISFTNQTELSVQAARMYPGITDKFLLQSVLCHTPEVHLHHLAVAWAVAVVMAIIQNYLPIVEIISNSRHATKTFDRYNKPNKYKEIWVFILDDLHPMGLQGSHFPNVTWITRLHHGPCQLAY